MNHVQVSLTLCILTLAACSGGSPAPAAEPATEPVPTAPAPAEPTTQPAAAPAAEAPPSGELPPVPEGAKVAFAEPADGATVKGPILDGKVQVTVKMAADGIEVKPSGPVETGSGHHHILIDTPAIPKGSVIPKDDKHVHFGKGQTETRLPLSPGEHTLTMQLADGIHRSYGPQLAAKIKITVEAEAAGAVPAEGETKK